MVAITTDHHNAGQLLTLATPALYRENLFRVLGIPVTATVQDARRRQKRLDMARKLGAHQPQVDGYGLLALRNPGEEDIHIALERLSDPVSRLLDEIFWFWPVASDGASDPGLKALEQGDVRGALGAWSAGSADGDSEALKEHNRAVLNHMIALELDDWIVAHRNPQAGGAHYQKPELKAQALWASALAGWRAVIESEPFWRGVKRRVGELDDKQLTTGQVRRIRESLPGALLNINARLALDAAERGDGMLAQTYVQLLRKGAADPGAADATLRAVLAPIRHRTESLCEQASKNASDDADKGAAAVSDLLEQTKPLLRFADLLLTEKDVSRAGMYDSVAEAALQCLIPFGNKSEDWDEVLRLLDMAIPFAKGQAQKTRLEENRKQAQHNLEGDRCFFCGKEKPDPTKAIEKKMFGDVNRTPNYYTNSVEITWRHISIEVPRCSNCAAIHGRRDAFSGTTWTLVVLLSLLSFFLGAEGGTLVVAVVVGVIGLIARSSHLLATGKVIPT